MRAVQTTVATAHASITAPVARIHTGCTPVHRHAAITNAGTYVTTDATPSRDSHDESHCENARHARAGRPRCNVDESNPALANTKPSTSGSDTARRACG